MAARLLQPTVGPCPHFVLPPTSPIDTVTVADAMHRGVITCAPSRISPRSPRRWRPTRSTRSSCWPRTRQRARRHRPGRRPRRSARCCRRDRGRARPRAARNRRGRRPPHAGDLADGAARGQRTSSSQSPGGWPAGMLSSLDVMAAFAGATPRSCASCPRPRPAALERDFARCYHRRAVMHPGVVTCSRRTAWSASRGRWPTSASIAWPSSEPRAVTTVATSTSRGGS